MAKKLKLDLNELEVQVFSVPDSYENVRGTVQGQSVAETDCSDTNCTCGIGNTCGTQETCGLGCGSTGLCTYTCTNTIQATNCPGGSNCEPFTDCAGCTSEWLCGGTVSQQTCQVDCPTQNPGDTVCYDTITCCES